MDINISHYAIKLSLKHLTHHLTDLQTDIENLMNVHKISAV